MSRYMRVVLLLAVLCLSGMGLVGVKIYSSPWPDGGPAGEINIREWVIFDPGVTSQDRNCDPDKIFYDVDPNATSLAQCSVPIGKTETLLEFHLIVGDSLVHNEEQCEAILEWSSDGTSNTATEIAASSIDVGDRNANSGKCDNKTIDTRGEFCRTTFSQPVTEGGFFWVKMTTGNNIDCNGAGPCSCARHQGSRAIIISSLSDS